MLSTNGLATFDALLTAILSCWALVAGSIFSLTTGSIPICNWLHYEYSLCNIAEHAVLTLKLYVMKIDDEVDEEGDE